MYIIYFYSRRIYVERPIKSAKQISRLLCRNQNLQTLDIEFDDSSRPLQK
jgi:hypothetical protein